MDPAGFRQYVHGIPLDLAESLRQRDRNFIGWHLGVGFEAIRKKENLIKLLEVLIMTKKTAGIEILVAEVLRTFSEPYPEDITDRVAEKIENNENWYRVYCQLKNNLSKHVVNTWLGKYTKEITGLNSFRNADAKRSSIIKTYTRLG